MKMQKNTVKLGIQDIWPIALVFIITGIGVAFGFDITDDVKDDFGADTCSERTDSLTLYNETSNLCYNSTGATAPVGTYAFNSTGDAEEGIANLTDKLPTIALVIVAAILITILVRNLGGLAN